MPPVSPDPIKTHHFSLCMLHSTGGTDMEAKDLLRFKKKKKKKQVGGSGLSYKHIGILSYFLSDSLLLGQPPQLIGVVKCRKKTPGLII